jgi:hypothetical protein
MTEFNIPLLSKLLLLESRVMEFTDNKKAQFQYAMVRLTYTHYSMRLIRLMLRLSPWSSTVIIIGRFYEGILPSINLRIKGDFLDLVLTHPPSLSIYASIPFLQIRGRQANRRYKPPWRENLSIAANCIVWEYYRS